MKQKNTILFHKDWQPLINSLPQDAQIEFWQLFMAYEPNNKPNIINPIVVPIWTFIQSQLDKFNSNYEQNVIDRNRVNGAKGGRPKKSQENPNNPMGLNETQKTLNKNKNINKNENINNNIEEGKPSPTSEKIDYDSFVNFYNGTCTNLPKVIKLTQSRKNAIRIILKKFNKKEIAEGLKIANETDFLIGNNKRGWKADFDFIIKENNLTKIIEGSYEKNNGSNTKGATGDELRSIVEAHFRN